MAFENLIIRARSVTKSYEKETVLSDFNLDVWNGSIIGFVVSFGIIAVPLLLLVLGFRKFRSKD